MKESAYKNYDELPLFLNCKTVAELLGICEKKCYGLLHSDGFPTLKIGKRLVVPREKFIAWVKEYAGGVDA